jgi:membrane protease subunit (stomatin/prohibitin family)
MMKVTRRQFRKMIREALGNPSGVDFDWTPDGLSMVMYVNGNEVMSFSTQKDVQDLITQLQDLLAGPMRTSP